MDFRPEGNHDDSNSNAVDPVRHPRALQKSHTGIVHNLRIQHDITRTDDAEKLSRIKDESQIGCKVVVPAESHNHASSPARLITQQPNR